MKKRDAIAVGISRLPLTFKVFTFSRVRHEATERPAKKQAEKNEISKRLIQLLCNTQKESKPHLERQLDVFIFQCLIGCRVGDLLKMTPDNVVNGQIEYIPRKTKETSR